MGDVAGPVAEVRKSLDACMDEIASLEKALETRDIIGQAKGILMARQLIDADAAFDVLRRASQRSNTKLRDVASEVVAGVIKGQPAAPFLPSE